MNMIKKIKRWYFFRNPQKIFDQLNYKRSKKISYKMELLKWRTENPFVFDNGAIIKCGFIELHIVEPKVFSWTYWRIWKKNKGKLDFFENRYEIFIKDLTIRPKNFKFHFSGMSWDVLGVEVTEKDLLEFIKINNLKIHEIKIK